MYHRKITVNKMICTDSSRGGKKAASETSGTISNSVTYV